MAVDLTPLGFKKPDGNERVRDGDNVISDNAQKADDLISEDRVTISGHAVRIASIESAVGVGGGLLMEDPSDPGFYIVGGP